MLNKIRSKVKIPFLTLVSAIAMLVAAYSSSACFIWFAHQPKCPSSLIKQD